MISAIRNGSENRIPGNAGISLFLDNIEEINDVCNKPVELYFDEENVYLV